MRDHKQPAFDLAKSYVVRRPFRFGGRTLVAGDPFPVRYISRRARQLYDQRWIICVVDVPRPTEMTDPGGAYMVPCESKGWWDVFIGDKQVNDRKLRRSDAEKLVEQSNAAREPVPTPSDEAVAQATGAAQALAHAAAIAEEAKLLETAEAASAAAEAESNTADPEGENNEQD